MHNAVRSNREKACFFCPGNCRRIAELKYPPNGQPLSHSLLRLAGISSLLQVNFPGFGQVCATALYNMTVLIMRIDFLTHGRFHTIHFPGWQKIAIWQCIQSIKISADAGKMFHMTIPWRHFFISSLAIPLHIHPCRGLQNHTYSISGSAWPRAGICHLPGIHVSSQMVFPGRKDVPDP